MLTSATRTLLQKAASDVATGTATGTASVSASVAAATASDAYSMYGGMTPNLAFNSAMAAIFGVLFILQLAAGVYTRQWWILVSFLCACALEVAGYIGRALGHNDTTNIDTFLLQFICLTIAPVFTMAGIYYQLGKLVEIYGHRFALLKNPMLYSWIFMACDVISLIVQAVGGGMSGSAAADNTDTATGDHIFVAGLAFQVASMSVFLVLWFHLLYQIFVVSRMEHTGASKPSWSLVHVSQQDIDYKYRPKFEFLRIHPKRWVFNYFGYALTAAVLLVYVRCIYRVVELAEGWHGDLITHEVYFIILDALMMSMATTLMTVFYPGFAFKGRTVKIPIEKGSESEKVDSTMQSHSSMEIDPYNDKETLPQPGIPSRPPSRSQSFPHVRNSTDRTTHLV
ncbi:LANO_0H23332g1_1 [Lachancea nothofagi CBS 11611]|uniref:Sphingoid long-chain base transporter RSB1 n=1 Tax=Lachancea nothofagi CBS 11611 TaxID=1266666 RepID=A0A1G4KNQ9_9SACH|nr:LANO_0H23332g1_1 [Lachancea nothofagi CBS 11611]